MKRVAALVLVIASCGDGGGAATTSLPVTTVGSAPTPTTSVPVPTTIEPSPLDAFVTDLIAIDGAEWLVAVADSATLRAQGLMGVVDLGGRRGMLFVFESDTTGQFWMKDTLIPLDIAFFDASGVQVGEVISMLPCDDDPCRRYAPGASYRFAVETVPGGFPSASGMTLTTGVGR